jgi:hypothetical protein
MEKVENLCRTAPAQNDSISALNNRITAARRRVPA